MGREDLIRSPMWIGLGIGIGLVLGLVLGDGNGRRETGTGTVRVRRCLRAGRHRWPPEGFGLPHQSPAPVTSHQSPGPGPGRTQILPLLIVPVVNPLVGFKLRRRRILRSFCVASITTRMDETFLTTRGIKGVYAKIEQVVARSSSNEMSCSPRFRTAGP